ncbi:transglutaminase family protein [bacterium]|nr:transglutaminase family protein [bacterium]
MRYRIVHRTRYVYSQPVVLAHSEARMHPRATAIQTCAAAALAIDPPPQQRAEHEDAFGNRVLYFAVQEPHQALTVTATSEVEIGAAAAAPASPAWETALQRLLESAQPETRLARQFRLDSPGAAVTAEVRAYAAPSFSPGRPLLEAVADLNQRIHRDFTFDPESTTVATPLGDVLAQRHGVCQDFAHLAIACVRAFGLPARYVSGYLETVAPPGRDRLQGADVSHAWFAVHVPDAGWVDFDPTNDLLPTDRHVTTAWGRDYTDVTPLKGVIFGGGPHTLEVSVDMLRL